LLLKRDEEAQRALLTNEWMDELMTRFRSTNLPKLLQVSRKVRVFWETRPATTKHGDSWLAALLCWQVGSGVFVAESYVVVAEEFRLERAVVFMFMEAPRKGGK
jgi:hypothetical protein